MSETDKPQPETTPAAPAEPPKASPPPSSPPPPGKKFARHTGGGRVRRLDPVPSLEDDLRFASKPNLRDLDAEIEGELAAALGGVSEKDLLAESPKQGQAAQPEGARKKGKVLSVHGADVFVDVPGGRSQGVLPIAQFPDGPPKPGTEVEFEIEGYDRANGLLLLSRRGAAVIADWSSVAEGMIVEARVTETNKGGLAVDVNGIRGFMPVSQIDLYRVEQPEEYVNQRLRCLVTEVNPEERNLVVSRRALLEKEREEMREKLWAELAEGQVREGIVRNVRDFGAFLDLGGVDGLLPIGEMSWQRVNDPTTLVQPGQKLKVVVLRIDRDARKVSLGLKQLMPSPWDQAEEKYANNTVVPGKVTRLAQFGAFVELEPGIEGLIHISELAPHRVMRVHDIVQPGQEVQVLILSADPQARRISLSLKGAAKQQEVPETAEAEEPQAPEKSKPQKPIPLRGGIGQQFTLPQSLAGDAAPSDENDNES